MHHIDRHAQHVGNRNGAVHRLAFHNRRPGQRVPFRALDALRRHFLLQLEHQLAVLCVHGRHGAEFQRALEALDQRFVAAHHGALVGHEMLEAVDAFLLHQRAHVAFHRLVPPGDGHVKRVIAGRFFGPAAPGLVRLHQVLLR